MAAVRQVCFVSAAVVACLSTSGVAQRAQEESAEDLFLAYQRGEYARVETVIGRLKLISGAPSRLLRDITRLSTAWPTLPSAAFALEATGLLVDETSSETDRVLRSMAERLRRGPVTEFEHAWSRAAVAVYERIPYAGPNTDVGNDEFFGNRALEDFLAAAIARLNDPSLELSLAILHEQRLYLEFWGHAVPSVVGLRDRDPGAWRGLDPPRALEAVATRFERLRQFPATRAESELRLGLVRYRQSRHDAALNLWNGLKDDDPVRIRYLGRLFTARLLVQEGPAAGAAVHLREALRLYPRTQSAGSLLIAVESLAGHMASADDLAADLLRVSDAADPWLTYFIPATEEWNERVKALRALLP